MSCVIQLKKDDHFVFISDSRSTTDKYCFTNANGVDDKMVRYYGDNTALIGHVGDARDISIIKQIPHLFDSFDEQHKTFDYNYVRDILTRKVRDEYLSLSIYPKSETYKFPTTLAIAKGDKCFTITDRGSIFEIKDYDFNGSGSCAALGAYSVSKDKDVVIKGLKAMQSAIKYNAYCGYPVLVASTKTDKSYILSKEEVDQVIKGERILDL